MSFEPVPPPCAALTHNRPEDPSEAPPAPASAGGLPATAVVGSLGSIPAPRVPGSRAPLLDGFPEFLGAPHRHLEKSAIVRDGAGFHAKKAKCQRGHRKVSSEHNASC